MELVPGRDCGECNACCVWLPIFDPPEIRKLGGEVCRNCAPGKGCTIYDDRPAMCRAYACAWRALPQLTDDWRPDRSKLLVEFANEDIPQGYQGPGLRFTLYRDMRQLEWPPFVTYVASLVSRNVPVFLAVPVQAGHRTVQVFLNEGLKPAVAARDLTATLLALSRAALISATAVGEKIELGGG
jgi:hypothetical protein